MNYKNMTSGDSQLDISTEHAPDLESITFNKLKLVMNIQQDTLKKINMARNT